MLEVLRKQSFRLIYLAIMPLLPLSLLVLIVPAPASAASYYTFAGKWGSLGSGDGQFNYPNEIATDPGDNVYVTDSWNNRIQKFNSSGAFLGKWGSFGRGDGQLNGPIGIAVGPGANVYVSETLNNRIQKFNSSGAFLGKWGSKGTGDGQFDWPHSITVGPGGNVYVADTWNHRVQKFNSSGAFLGKWGRKGTGNGQFDKPDGITVDSGGNVYVADTWNHRVQKFNSNGTFLGKWGRLGGDNGEFFVPTGITVDSENNVYVADTWNHRVQKFNSSGTFLGKWGGKGTGDGQFKFPDGITVSSGGNVYVADTLNHRVQKFALINIGPTTRLNAPRYSTDVSRIRRFRIYWSATDPSGIATYDIQYKVGRSGGWRDWLMNTKKKSSNFKGRQSKSYYFRARAKDNAGNVGRFSKPKRTIVPHDNNQLMRGRTGFGHTLKKRRSRYYLGTVRYSTSAGDAVTYRFKGNSIALISTKARNRSKAKIYVDGKYKRTVKTAIRRTKYHRAIYQQKFRKISRHTITIVNVGDRQRLDLDALAAGR